MHRDRPKSLLPNAALVIRKILSQQSNEADSRWILIGFTVGQSRDNFVWPGFETIHDKGLEFAAECGFG